MSNRALLLIVLLNLCVVLVACELEPEEGIEVKPTSELGPNDGIYLRSQDDSAPWIMGQDGQKLSLGAREDLDIQKIELSSQNNANTRFYLSVTVPYDENIGPSSYILIVAGTAYRQSVSGSSQEKTSSLSFYISEEENAKQVSRYMKTPLVYRRHPRHNLLISLCPHKAGI